jgi:hypothetical protein
MFWSVTVNVCAVELTFDTVIVVPLFTVSVAGANTRAPFAPWSSVVPPPPAAGEVPEDDDELEDELHAAPTSPRTHDSITSTSFVFAIWDTSDLPHLAPPGGPSLGYLRLTVPLAWPGGHGS